MPPILPREAQSHAAHLIRRVARHPDRRTALMARKPAAKPAVKRAASNPRRPRGTGASYVHEQLKNRILHLELMPGTLLDETEISRQFGVSRSPVREALIRLSAEGLVQNFRNRTAIVAQFDIATLPSYFDAMQMLYRLGCRLAAAQSQSGEAGEAAPRPRGARACPAPARHPQHGAAQPRVPHDDRGDDRQSLHRQLDQRHPRPGPAAARPLRHAPAGPGERRFPEVPPRDPERDREKGRRMPRRRPAAPTRSR